MKWLRSKIKSLKKYLTASGINSREDSLNYKINYGTIQCNWTIRKSSKKLIDENFNSALFLRVRDISGDGTNASVTLETTTSTDHADIHLPTTQGKILLELGYKAYKGDFITLEYKIFNLGEKKIKAIRYIDWFNIEPDNIHQQMYEMATRGVPAGGSERRT
jgi:hypothetical protein